MTTCAPRNATGLRHRVADHAASGALRDLLEHHRLSYAPEPLSEGAVFGFAGALDLRVRTAAAAVPTIDVEGRSRLLERDLCRNLGIDATWSVGDDPDDGWELLRRALDGGRATLVRADLAELDYRAARRHDTRHAIVVTSYDVDAGIAWVLDAAFPEPQRCRLDALAAARRSRAWPEPARHALLSLAPRPRLRPHRAAVQAAVAATVTAMRRTKRSEHPFESTGLRAADALLAAWRRLPELDGERLDGTLRALRYRIREGGTGGALYRSLQARFEHDAAALIGSRELGRAALLCDELADAWRAFAASLDGDDAMIAHALATPWLERIRALEHRHVEALEAHLASR